jgi:hypothetical protein
MGTPFPGMDPYLEHPALWPDVHNRLVTALADALAPLVAPRYYVGVERRTYRLDPDDLVLVGVSEAGVIARSEKPPEASAAERKAAVLEVEVPMVGLAGEDFLEVRDVEAGKLVTVIEFLSPANKLHPDGRKTYEEKRTRIFGTATHLIEIDLLRDGKPMPLRKKPPASAYRILISRSTRRPRAQLIAFGLRQPIPTFRLPLLAGDEEPEVDLNAVLHGVYERARFDLRLDYAKPSVPPIEEEDAGWARERIEAWRAAER